MKKKGKITPNGVVLKTHENATAVFLTEQGFIIDLRHTKRHQIKCIRELRREFEKSKRIKRLKIITKSGKMLDFEK